MKGLWTAVMGLVLGAGAWAAKLETRIAAVERPTRAERGVMVLAETDGHVFWASEKDKSLVRALEEAAEEGYTVRVDYRPRDKHIRGVELLAQESRPEGELDLPGEEPEYAVAYEPTVLPGMAYAQSAFNSMDRNTFNSSQCYNRAHGWTYDLWRTRGIHSEKLFLFFTRKYIRAYRYHWWFHVTPLVVIGGDGGGQAYTMDRSFSERPLAVRTWTNIFMKNDAYCPQVSKYSDYRNHQYEQWCYLIRRPMYFRQPLDINRQERTGYVKTEYLTWEVRQARRQAFVNWRRYNP